MSDLSWSEFERVDMRVGTITGVEEFPEARNPAWKLTIDFGEELGTLKSSAQITELYSHADLMGKQIIAVVNFPKKQIGPFMSECLVLGVVGTGKGVVLLQPEQNATNGLKIS
jgi:tRNA-binding protein